MFFHIPYYNPPKYPIEKKIWIKIRFVHETDKAILVYPVRSKHKRPNTRSQQDTSNGVYCNGKKLWIPKSQVYKIRLREGVFEIYIKESSVR